MKKIVCLLIASTFLLTAVSANAGLMLSGTDTYGGSVYDVYVYNYDGSVDKTWEAANSFALGQGGYLATLTTSDEDTFVTKLVQSLLGYNKEVWAGGFQDGTSGGPEDDWTWVNGEGAFTNTNWTPGEPNDYYGEDSEQHLGINWAKGTWNDEGDRGIRNVRGLVVESAIPEPSIIALFGLGLLGLGFARRSKKA